MAKKTNRPKNKAAPVAPRKTVAPPVETETPPADATAAPDVPRAPRQRKLSRSQVAADRLDDEYAYITGDLRRVFILAAAMFARLIALNVIFGIVS